VQAPNSNQPKNQVLKHQSLKLFYFDMQLKKKIELMIYFFLSKFLDQKQNDAKIIAT